MPVNDTLTTRIQIDASGYAKGSKTVIDSTRKMGSAIDKMQKGARGKDAITNLGSKLKSAFGGLKSLGSGALGVIQGIGSAIGSVTDFVSGLITKIIGAATAFGAMSFLAVQQFAKFESIKLTFAGIAGSLEKAEQMMKAIKSYSLKSVFDEEPLAKAALQLTQLKLSAAEYLPVIEAIAIKSGEITPDSLMEVVSIMRRLKGGQIADALGPEGLGRFGIGKEELVKFGAIVDSSGDFKMNLGQAFQTLKNIANSPESLRIKEMLEGSPETRISNALGALSASVREFGAAMAQWVIPALETIANVVEYIASSNLFTNLGKSISQAFGMDGEKNAFAKFLFTVVSAFEIISDYIRNILSNLGEFWKGLKNLAKGFLEILTGPMQLILKFWDMIKKTKLQDEFNKSLHGLVDKGLGGDWLDAMGVPELTKSISDSADSKYAQYEAFLKKKEKEKDAKMPDFGFGNSLNSTLPSIAKNTAKTAELVKEHVDLVKGIVGGNKGAGNAITPVELAGNRRVIRHEFFTGNKMFDELLNTAINGALLVERKERRYAR